MSPRVLVVGGAGSGRDIPVEEGLRRVGDRVMLVADASLARKRLGGQSSYPAPEDIIAQAWHWECSR